MVAGVYAIYINTDAPGDPTLPEEEDMTGTARIQRDSATVLSLQLGRIPLKISGVWAGRQITAPVTISNAGLSANTTYFVYARDSGGSTVLSLETTGHVTSSGSGEETKSGDDSKTLVGMIRADASAQFVDSATLIGVLSWFNRKGKSGASKFTTSRSTTLNGFIEIHPEIQIGILTWGDEDILLSGWYQISHTANPGFALTALSVDGGVASLGGFGTKDICTTNPGASSQTLSRRYNEGYHVVSLLGASGSVGTATWDGNHTQIFVAVRG